MKPITNTVELAEKIITEAFKDKKDKGGIPYTEHLYRVADKLKGETHIDQDLQIKSQRKPTCFNRGMNFNKL